MRTPEYVTARVTKLRAMLLAFRFMYYVWNESLITDFEYDKREQELKALVAEYPDIAQQCKYNAECPTRTVGSSQYGDYPVEIQSLAERLWLTDSEIRMHGLENPATTLAELEQQLDSIVKELGPLAADSLPAKPTQPGLF